MELSITITDLDVTLSVPISNEQDLDWDIILRKSLDNGVKSDIINVLVNADKRDQLPRLFKEMNTVSHFIQYDVSPKSLIGVKLIR